MNEEKELNIKKSIIDSLGDNEYLLSFNKARKSESIYVTLLNNEDRYLTFRTSHHSSYSGFLSIPTFNTSNLINFKNELNDYLSIASWINFSYNDFFILSVIKNSLKHGVKFQIDDLYSIFSEESQGMIFYQIRKSSKKKRVDVNSFDEETNQAFRKLYSTALISSYKNGDQTLSVYISEPALRLLDIFSKNYLQTFIKDNSNINWNNISLPTQSIKKP